MRLAIFPRETMVAACATLLPTDEGAGADPAEEAGSKGVPPVSGGTDGASVPVNSLLRMRMSRKQDVLDGSAARVPVEVGQYLYTAATAQYGLRLGESLPLTPPGSIVPSLGIHVGLQTPHQVLGRRLVEHDHIVHTLKRRQDLCSLRVRDERSIGALDLAR
jgi:hypothetical protein